MVIDVSEERNQLRVFINEIIARKATAVNEGLPLRARLRQVERAETVMVTALDRDGQRFTINASRHVGVCIQHEMDHRRPCVRGVFVATQVQSRIRNKVDQRQRANWNARPKWPSHLRVAARA